MTLTNFAPANHTEKLLLTLPKECTCSICQGLKNDAKESLGEKRFKELCKLLQIIV